MKRAWKLGAVLALSLALVTGSSLAGLYTVSRSPDYCRRCHVMEEYVLSWETPDLLAHRHYLAEIACQTCHPQTMTELVHEIVATVRGNYFVPLPELEISQQECLSCHGDYSDLARATAHLDENPHASHLGEEECFQCHKMHRKSPGMKYCVTCHHTGELVTCSTCHDDRPQ
jgi:cytochrome c nitrite reductase small subunit